VNRTSEIIVKILEKYEGQINNIKKGPFKGLIRTILSQNTTRTNTQVAYERLEKMVGINPKSLANSEKEEIIEAIKPAGMYNLRSEVIKNISKKIIKEYDGDLSLILNLPFEKAREELMSFKGVGRKTADVTLLFEGDMPSIPIDTHIFRITKRLNLVSEHADYEEIRKILEENTKKEKYLQAHVGLINFGREYCRAINPRCNLCFLNNICSYPDK
jgi:endonuclease-3